MTERAKEVVKLSWGTLFQGSLILCTVVLSFAYVKARADMNTRDIMAHRVDDEKKWEKAFNRIDENSDDIDVVRIQNTRIESNQREILRRLDENRSYYEKSHSDMINFMSTFEVKQ